MMQNNMGLMGGTPGSGAGSPWAHNPFAHGGGGFGQSPWGTAMQRGLDTQLPGGQTVGGMMGNMLGPNGMVGRMLPQGMQMPFGMPSGGGMPNAQQPAPATSPVPQGVGTPGPMPGPMPQPMAQPPQPNAFWHPQGGAQATPAPGAQPQMHPTWTNGLPARGGQPPNLAGLLQRGPMNVPAAGGYSL